MKSVLILIVTLFAFGATAQGPWTQVSDESIVQKHIGERLIIPEAYDTYALDVESLKSAMSSAPMEEEFGKKARMSLPVGDGTVETFEFVESPAMSPVLSAKFPWIKSYKGISIENPHNTAWINFGRSEFRGVINKLEGQVFIDPYYSQAEGHYIAYHSKDYEIDTEDLQKTCGLIEYEQEFNNNPKPEGVYVSKNYGVNKSSGIPVTLTTYRLAITSTGLWSASQGNTTAFVMERLNTAANRLNSVFIPELAVKFELIDDNDKLIFFRNQEPLTPFTDEDTGGQCLRENTNIINNAVGINSYDMGHCFTVRCDDGVAGVANFGSVCNQRKGNGVSCVGNADLSRFMMTTTAHELGHQFTTGHTWANCSDNTANQFSAAQNCEPGSGSTIMSYFGACGNQNLNGPESFVFHTCSLIPMTNFVATGEASTCGTKEMSSNSHPDVFILDKPNTIPISTPFELTGDATDMENDPMEYVWEQIDGGTAITPLGSAVGNSPLFRTFPPNQNKTRLFPRLSNILQGNDNIEERLPTFARELNFAFTVRDNNLNGGGVNWETIRLEATEAAGPFLVTTPRVLTTASVNEEILVEWDVAGTDGPEVDCQLVDIFFSPDNGQNFTTKLLSATPNDGSAMVRLPNQLTQNGKIKVKAANNVFFNISRNNVRVVEPTVPSFFVDAEETSFEFCLPNTLSIGLTGTSFLGYDEAVQLEVVSGLPAIASHEFTVNPMPADGTSSLNIDLNEVLEGGTFNVMIRAIGVDADTIYQNILIEATGSFLGDVALESPADDTRGLAVIPDFNWVGSPNASSYYLEVSTSPDFSDDNIIFAKNTGLENSEDAALFNLENSSLYFWRVTTFNDCVGSVTTPINIFSTQALNCRIFASDDVPLNIPSGAASSVTSEIDIAEGGTVSDVNVELIKGSHNNLSDVRASIVSPEGTSVVLWQGCTAFNRIDAGFDDASSVPNDCPDKNGLKIRPLQPLSSFIGQELEGKWLLRIDDVVTGNGGTIDEYQVELCSSTSLFSPVIVINEVAQVAPGKGSIIENTQLLSEDENNSAEELVYTMMDLPTKGDLIRNGTIMTIGDQFTQRTINNGLIVYKHNGTQEEEDQFTFIVEDGEGGWINRTDYLINVVEGGSTTAVEDINRADEYFDIFPNPASDLITINQLEADNSDWNLTMTANGQVVSKQTFKNAMEMNVSDLPSGLYLMQLQRGDLRLAKKISIVK